jgi:NADH dehydrogenase
MARVVVVGAGYGGLLAAVRLAHRSPQAEVTLVNQSDVFVERVRLHQYAANQAVRQRKLVDILAGTRVQLVRGTVDRIDPAARRVLLTGGALPYDYLVYALGSVTDLDAVPGLRDHAYSINVTGERSAEDLKTLLPTLDEMGGRMVVAGGGPLGIETAAEFAESYPGLQVTLVTRGEVLPQFPGKPRAHVLETLSRLGVTVRGQTPVSGVAGRAMLAADGVKIPFDVCVWCGGFRAVDVAARSGLAVNALGQVLTDPGLRSVSHPEIFALGDAAAPAYRPRFPIQMGAFTATVTGAHAADCVHDVLGGRQPRRLSFVYYGQAIALGRKDVVGFNRFPDGKAHWPTFTGPLGVRSREFFVDLLHEGCMRGEPLGLGLVFRRLGGRRPGVDSPATPAAGARAA